MVWLLLLLLYVQGIAEGASKPDVVNVGAILSLSSITGKVSKIAIEAAEKDVNSDPSVLGGRKLSISILDSNNSGFLGITGGILLSTNLALLDNHFVFGFQFLKIELINTTSTYVFFVLLSSF